MTDRPTNDEQPRPDMTRFDGLDRELAGTHLPIEDNIERRRRESADDHVQGQSNKLNDGVGDEESNNDDGPSPSDVASSNAESHSQRDRPGNVEGERPQKKMSRWWPFERDSDAPIDVGRHEGE